MGEEIIKYVNKMRHDLDIVKIKPWYNTITCKPGDSIQEKEIDEYLGLSSGKEEASYNISPEFQHNFELVFGMLDELTIGIRRK